MRDIDFDELDKAVNRFLGKPETEVIATEEKPVVERKITDAGVFHENLLVKKDDSIKEELPKSEPVVEPEIAKKQPEEAAIIPVKIKTKKREIQDNFSEKPQRAHKSGKPEIIDSLETAKFEEPILEDFLDENSKDLEFGEFEKIMPELKSVSEHSTEDFVQPSNEEKPIEIAQIVDEVKESAEPASQVAEPTAPAPVALPVRDSSLKVTVPQRAGVFQIEENDDEVVTFGAKPKTAVQEAENKSQDTAQSEATELVTPVPQISTKIEVENNVVVEPETAENQTTTKTIKPISSQAEVEETDLKTPFVQNVKIEKRPLGSANSAQSGSSFEFKPALDRNRKIKKAKHENMQPVEPILSRDEYSQPVMHKKKKTGWGVVFLIMLLVAGLGVLGGVAALYLMNQ